MMTAEDLKQFNGTDHYYRTGFKGFLITDGVRYLCEHAGAGWLVDIIAGYQSGTDLEGRMVHLPRGLQEWRLLVNGREEDPPEAVRSLRDGVLYCLSDIDPEVLAVAHPLT